MIALVLSIVAILYPNITTQVLIYILSIVLLLNGVTRLVIGEFARAFPKWFRGFFFVVGLLTIVLSVVVSLFSAFGFLALVLMISFTFMFNGIARIVKE